MQPAEVLDSVLSQVVADGTLSYLYLAWPADSLVIASDGVAPVQCVTYCTFVRFLLIYHSELACRGGMSEDHF